MVTRLSNNTYGIKVISKPNAISSFIAKISGQEKKELRSLQDFKSSLAISEAKYLNKKYPDIKKRWGSGSQQEKINLREEVIKYKIESNMRLKAKFADRPEKLQELASALRPEIGIDQDFAGTLDAINSRLKKLA